MPMTAKREVHRLSEYLIEGAVWGPPKQNLFLFLLPIPCLNFEQKIAGILISIHFLTVVANFNNLQTHPVCNVLSTNEINPSENIFNNNVMHNGISKIVKSWTFNQFLLKSRRLQPHYIDAGDITQPGTEELLLLFRTIHQESLIVLRVFRVWADSNLNVPGWPP